MAITYQAGRRIQGTSTDFGTNGAGIPAVSGGWKELTRVTLGSTSTTMTTPTFTNKRYYKVLVHGIQSSGSIETGLGLNGLISGNPYASRLSVDGGIERTGINANYIADGWFSDPNEYISEINIANLAGKEKLIIGHTGGANTAGAGTAPKRMEWVGKFVPIPDVDVSSILITGSGTFAVGSEIVVLGWDPEDPHTTNFWTELYSDSQTGQSTDNIDTGTFTNKKYLWVQLWCKGTANTTVKMTFNNSTDSTYAYRYSNDGNSGSADPTPATSSSNIVLHNTKANDDKFINMFIVNDGTNEILGIGHTVEGNSDGSGIAPQRRETVFKRSTATAITDIEFDNDDTGNFTDWELKVWGSN